VTIDGARVISVAGVASRDSHGLSKKPRPYFDLDLGGMQMKYDHRETIGKQVFLLDMIPAMRPEQN
jgi:hypothetical protein